MKKKLKEMLHIATISSDWKTVASEYGLGIELDQFCSAENMDAENFKQIALVLREQLKVFNRVILHAPFNELFPAAIDPKSLQLAYDRYEQAFKLAKAYDVHRMVVHSGYVPLVYFKEWHLERSVDFWIAFMKGKPAGFTLLIENVLEDEPYMMKDLMEGIGHRLKKENREEFIPNIRICLDTGHANCVSSIDILEWVAVLGPYIGHVHLHNNDGDWDYHKSLGDGSINMEAVLESLVQGCAPDTTYTIESTDCRASLKWLAAREYL